MRIDGKLPVGAYLLEAKSGSLSARDLILVTDASLVLKSSPKQALVYFSHALTGAPIANANVALWESYYQNSKWHWRKLRQTTNSDGLAAFALKSRRRLTGAYLSLLPTTSGRLSLPAIRTGTTSVKRGAFTPSPIALPTGRRKLCSGNSLRAGLNSGVYSTPANQVVEYRDQRSARHQSERRQSHTQRLWQRLGLAGTERAVAAR